MFDVQRDFISKKFHRREYWFRTWRYGWGWYPAGWEGWTITLIYAGAVAFIVRAFIRRMTIGTYVFTSTVDFFLLLFVLTALLLWICYSTGEPLRFRWGDDDTKPLDD